MTPGWLSTEAQEFLKRTYARRSAFRRRFSYFYEEDIRFLQRIIPRDSAVFLAGCDVSDLAAHLSFREIAILELDEISLSLATPPSIRRLTNLQELNEGPIPDYIVLPYSLSFLSDVQEFLETLQASINPKTRIVLLQYNFLWTPLLKLFEKLSLKAPSQDLNWFSLNDLRNLLNLTNYDVITTGARSLLPIRIPLLSAIVNRYLAPLPFFQWACLRMHIVARPRRHPVLASGDKASVSIIIPARNEAGNIKPLLDRLPVIGNPCEVIFVEGHSKDHTWDEIQRQIGSHPRRSEFILKAYSQNGEGKADAMELGFSLAHGEVLMILDADLSVQPEDLPHFYSALIQGSAEFLNGSRLVYKMESKAMQVLNLFFNKVFGAFVSWLIGQPVKDTLCGTKVMFRSDYERLERNYSGLNRLDPFGDFRLLFGAGLLNLKICDVPVRYRERTYGSTNIRRFKHGWQLLKMCLSCWRYLK